MTARKRARQRAASRRSRRKRRARRGSSGSAEATTAKRDVQSLLGLQRTVGNEATVQLDRQAPPRAAEPEVGAGREQQRRAAKEWHSLEGLVGETYQMELNILARWRAALEAFLDILEGPSAQEAVPQMNEGIARLVASKVLGSFANPAGQAASHAIDVMGPLSDEVARATEADTSRAIRDYVVRQRLIAGRLIAGYRDDDREVLGLESLRNHAKDEAEKVEETAEREVPGFEEVRRPDPNVTYIFDDEEARRAFEAFRTARLNWEKLYSEVRERAAETSQQYFYRYLAERWVKRGSTGVFGGRHAGKFLVKVAPDYSVEEVEISGVPRSDQLAEGFFKFPGVDRINLMDIGVERRIHYMGRDPQHRYSHLPSDVVVIRANGMLSEGECSGSQWRKVLGRLSARGMWARESDFA